MSKQNGDDSAFGVAAGSAWRLISDELPKYRDRVACCAPHRNGGMMYWAGRIVGIIGVRRRFAIMETRGGETHRFILTRDTLWLRLPPLPNTRASATPEKNV